MTLTNKQKEVIKDNLQAYINNFGYIRIEKISYDKGFYIFTSDSPDANYTQYCYNIDYLNGWLYGAVQSVNGIMKKKEQED